MFEEKKIAFIGPGEMAEAMIHGLIRRQVAQPQALLAAGPRQERLDQLHNKYGIQIYLDNAQAARQADVVVLSVKPQRMDRVLSRFEGRHQPIRVSAVDRRRRFDRENLARPGSCAGGALDAQYTCPDR